MLAFLRSRITRGRDSSFCKENFLLYHTKQHENHKTDQGYRRACEPPAHSVSLLGLASIANYNSRQEISIATAGNLTWDRGTGMDKIETPLSHYVSSYIWSTGIHVNRFLAANPESVGLPLDRCVQLANLSI